MFENKNSSAIFSLNAYSVAFVEKRILGEEWNLVEWNRKHREIDCHRLYYRTDKDGGVASVRLIDGKVLPIESGKVYFIPAFSVLQSNIEGQMEKYYIHFRSDSFVFNVYRFLKGKYSVDATPLTESLFRMVLENYDKNSHGAQMKVQGAMNLILAPFFDKDITETSNLARFQPVFSFIDKSFKENLTLQDMASVINVSPVYFANSFKKAFGISPKQYLLNKRLAYAQQLLLETDLSVKEIAYEVGFDNQNYFSEYFASKIGVSALKYRKRAFPRNRDCIL